MMVMNGIGGFVLGCFSRVVNVTRIVFFSGVAEMTWCVLVQDILSNIHTCDSSLNISKGHRLEFSHYNVIPESCCFSFCKQYRPWWYARLCRIPSASLMYAKKIQYTCLMYADCDYSCKTSQQIGRPNRFTLTLKAPITTAADKFCDIFPNLRKIRYDISWEPPASRRFSWNVMPYLLFLKSGQIWNCRPLQIIGGALRVNHMVLVTRSTLLSCGSIAF